jgi:PAS domain S-box-containing protein
VAGKARLYPDLASIVGRHNRRQDVGRHCYIWNRAAEALFGYASAEMIGGPIARLHPPDRVAEEAMILERIKRGARTAAL